MSEFNVYRTRHFLNFIEEFRKTLTHGQHVQQDDDLYYKQSYTMNPESYETK